MKEMTNYMFKILRDKLRTSEPTHGITEPSLVPASPLPCSNLILSTTPKKLKIPPTLRQSILDFLSQACVFFRLSSVIKAESRMQAAA